MGEKILLLLFYVQKSKRIFSKMSVGPVADKMLRGWPERRPKRRPEMAPEMIFSMEAI